MKLSNWHQGVATTLMANIIWGVAAPMVKLSLGAIPPFSLLFLRSMFVCLLLAPIFEFILLPRQKYKLTKRDKWDIFLAGFLGVFLNLAFYFAGQKLTSVIDAFVIAVILNAFSVPVLTSKVAFVMSVGMGISFVSMSVAIVYLGYRLLNWRLSPRIVKAVEA
jgi:drug/metabolite transporter (DMT)-like permease